MPCSSQTLGDDTFAGSGLPLLSSFGEENVELWGKGVLQRQSSLFSLDLPLSWKAS